MSTKDGRRSTKSDLNLTPQQQQVCLAPSFPLPCPTHSDTSQARLEAVLCPPPPRKTLAWAMKTSKDQPQFLCNAQVSVVLPSLHERDPERLRDRALMWAGLGRFAGRFLVLPHFSPFLVFPGAQILLVVHILLACAPGSTNTACLCSRVLTCPLLVLPGAQILLSCAPGSTNTACLVFVPGSTSKGHLCSREHKQGTPCCREHKIGRCPRWMRLLPAPAVTAPPGVGTDATSRVHTPAAPVRG